MAEPDIPEHRSAPEPQPSGHPRRWLVLGLLGVAQLMLILDVTVVAIALPHMGGDLGVGREVLTWVVSGYALTFGSLMLLGGKAADLFGPKPIALTGLTVFTAASLIAGLADSGGVLLGARVAQGVGAALLSPAALSIVVRMFDGDERNKALGIWSALGGGGAALGVLLGGLLTAGPGWPWVFFVNVPVGLVVLVVLLGVLPTLPAAGGSGRLDVFGAILVAGATGSLIYLTIRAGETGWLTWTTLGLGVLAVVLYAGFGVWQRRARSPLMDLGLLTRRPVLAGVFVILVGTALMVAVFFVGSFFLQTHAGHGALVTGLLFLPVAAATMAAASLAGRLIGRTGARPLGAIGLLAAAVGFGIPPLWAGTAGMVVGVSVAAAGLGILFVVASATALGQVAPHEAGVASGLVSTFHEFGASAGAAVMSSVAAASLTGGAQAGFDRAFVVGAGVAAAAAVLAVLVIPPARPAAVG